MKIIIFIITFYSILNSNECLAQLEPFGLQGETITSISTLPDYYFWGTEFNVCASTEKNGVYLKNILHTDSNWVNLGLQGKTIQATSMQNRGVGPMNFQTIFTAVKPDISHSDSTLIYKFNYHFDSTWTPASYGLNFDPSASSTSILSFNYEGHNPPFPVILLYASKIYRCYYYFPNSIEWYLVSSDYKWNVLATSQMFLDGVIWTGGKTDSEEPILAKSTNFGDTWLFYSLDEFHNPCTAIVIDPINTDILYLSINGEIIKTTDGGFNWFRTGLQNPSATFTSIIVDQYNNDHILYGGYTLANNFLLYESYNQGSSWKRIESDSALPGITSMIADTIDNTFSVFIGTRGNGVFRYKSSLTSLEGESGTIVPARFLLNQNYPNPFNPTTQINYELPVSGLVTLKVFDILGREISTLVNEEKDAGKYKVEFSSGGLSSGIYFYTLTSREYSRTKKMVLLR